MSMKVGTNGIWPLTLQRLPLKECYVPGIPKPYQRHPSSIRGEDVDLVF